ncbi:MAG: hypothetical protein EBT18_10455, partial [Gammaproteobacteria bacterium]|nr:hypothetical protein [Gammaproteobacteria bacterium]
MTETTATDTTVRAGVIDVIFDEPFEFGATGDPRPRRQPEVARLACGGGVKIDNESVNEAALAALVLQSAIVEAKNLSSRQTALSSR